MIDREGEDEILAQWCRRLVETLQILDLEVDQKTILGLAGRSAHAVLRPAAPLTTFIVGYAAGLAAAGGKVTPIAAVKSAADVAFQLCRDGVESSPDDKGWVDTGQ